ncbi:hypothetical protein OC834_007681, partial [Tilletia horrida]
MARVKIVKQKGQLTIGMAKGGTFTVHPDPASSLAQTAADAQVALASVVKSNIAMLAGAG